MNDKNDEALIQLFLARDENAISTASEKYRGFCLSVLSNFLALKEDCEECMNDAMLVLWNTIPPEHPKSLSGYLAGILKKLAVSRSRAENAWKRGGRVLTVGEEFLSDISDGRTLADDYESALAGRILNEFLDGLNKESRKIFVSRYWYDEDITHIAKRSGRSVGSIKMLLMRLRKDLAERLKKEGIIYE